MKEELTKWQFAEMNSCRVAYSAYCAVWEVCNCAVLLPFNPLHHFSRRLCGSYPQEIIVPAWITDKELESVASFRSWKRIPAVVYR